MSSPELLPAEEFGHARLSAPSESQSGSDAEPPVMPNATGRSVLIRRGPRLEQRDELAPSEIEHGAPSGTSCASSPLSWKRPQAPDEPSDPCCGARRSDSVRPYRA